MDNKWLASALFLVLLAVSFSYVMRPVEAQTSQTREVNITSPIQNQTYQSNIVPLEFTVNPNIESPPNWTVQSLVLGYDLDGQQGYHAPQHSVRIDQFYPPFHSSYSTSMDLPNGNHTLWVVATFWGVTPDGEHFPIEKLSQFLNFEVKAPNPSVSSSPTPTSTVPEFPILAILPLSIFIISLVALRKLKKQIP
jgi:hypothetical protein